MGLARLGTKCVILLSIPDSFDVFMQSRKRWGLLNQNDLLYSLSL